MTFHVYQCADCQLTLFPERYMCPACGGMHWRDIEAGVGTIEQITRLFSRAETPGNEPLVLATVRTEPEAWVVAQLEGTMARGERVRLRVLDDGKVMAVRA
ncbi:zinc ribbon domain-containing protein [Paraburkholderia oxyphila]|uniref:zinc ribbon domain-containing protein n=1 Tax=Paraburkholderia oxyphila TaxID=614212 RepID=UPI000694AA4C|nr:hypothetical protein [Paraburkholderia oxyphila]